MISIESHDSGQFDGVGKTAGSLTGKRSNQTVINSSGIDDSSAENVTLQRSKRNPARAAHVDTMTDFFSQLLVFGISVFTAAWTPC